MSLSLFTPNPEVRFLGPVVPMVIQSTVGLVQVLPDYTIAYPAQVVEALGELYREYNHAFRPLIGANREWNTDYQHCFFGSDAGPVNFGVQVDMLGLTPEFLRAAMKMNVSEVHELLRRMIFEIENSLAMYQLTERVSGVSYRTALSDLRRSFNKPIALLAVTEDKYRSMLGSEFGKTDGADVCDADVQALSGFDRLFGPESFSRYLHDNNGECGYLLYVRSSDPIDKLKKPDLVVEHPLLGNEALRQIIKACALTFNVDAPGMDSTQRINDTKGYMPLMGMAYEIASEIDLHREGRLAPRLIRHLLARGVSPEQVESGEVHLRGKPAQGAFGCYGHVSGALTDGTFRSELRRNMRQRGSYVIQPELNTPRITDALDNRTYTYIDRVFLTHTGDRPVFLGGIRMLLPVDSREAQQKRIHGNSAAVFGRVVSEE